MTRVEVTMGGLNCANCAGIIEEKVKARKEIDRANLNFINKKLTVDIGDGYDQDQVVDQLISIIDDTEPGLDISLKLAGRTVTAEDFRAGLSDQTDKNHIEDGKSERGHEHKESNSFLIAAIILYAVAMIGNRLGLPYPAYLAFLAAAYILSGKDVILAAVRNIIKGNALDENFLMTVATSGAAAIGEYPEAVGVMLFYGVGEASIDLAIGWLDEDSAIQAYTIRSFSSTPSALFILITLNTPSVRVPVLSKTIVLSDIRASR